MTGPYRDFWFDQAAGPVIRPYAFVGGRTVPAGESFDLIAMVRTRRHAAVDPEGLEPGHLQVVSWCRFPRSVAELASELSLPLGVLRVILADLREQNFVVISSPAAPGRRINSHVLRRAADGLRRL
jgi:hypothetical protein